MDDLHQSLIRIAPERESLFDKKYKDFTLIYLDCDDWILNVQTGKKEIQLSSFVVEFLWASAYAHYNFYYKIFCSEEYGSQKELRVSDFPEIQPSLDLLEWAVYKLTKNVWCDWPDHLPQPTPNPEKLSDENVASEFARGAVAAYLHHELAHIALGHNGPSRIDTEKAADAYAWRWILGDRRDYDAGDLTKRILMLVHAFSIPIIIDIHKGCLVTGNHPLSVERLSRKLHDYQVPENHVAYAYAFSTLHCHVESSQYPMPKQDKPYNSFKESFDAVINHILTFPICNPRS